MPANPPGGPGIRSISASSRASAIGGSSGAAHENFEQASPRRVRNQRDLLAAGDFGFVSQNLDRAIKSAELVYESVLFGLTPEPDPPFRDRRDIAVGPVPPGGNAGDESLIRRVNHLRQFGAFGGVQTRVIRIERGELAAGQARPWKCRVCRTDRAGSAWR